LHFVASNDNLPQLAFGLPSSNMKQMDEEKAKHAFRALSNMIQQNLGMLNDMLEQTNQNTKEIKELKARIETLLLQSKN